MLHPDDWQTTVEALEAERIRCTRMVDLYTNLEQTKQITQGEIAILKKAQLKLAAINTTLARVRALAAQGSWQPVSQLVNDQDTLHADEIAISIGTNDVCMGLFEWPDDGNEYAVCKWIPSDAMNFRHLYDAILNAHGMATGIYIQSDAEMRQRIGHFLGDIIRKCGEAMENPNSQWVAAQDATPAPPQVVPVEDGPLGTLGAHLRNRTLFVPCTMHKGIEHGYTLAEDEYLVRIVEDATPAPPQGELPGPLWDDERIAWYASNVATTAWEHKKIYDAMRKIRDDCEAAKQPRPALDWSNAPEWAMYHLYNCMGSGLWVNAKHEVDTTWYSGWRSLLREPMDKIADYSGYQLPIGTDWRATLQPRPALDAGGA